MPAIDRSLDAVAFITEHFRDILRRRLRELAGLFLLTLAFLAAIALATWSVQDPSLSHATQAPVHNLLGFPGAIFSDLTMQLLGLAATMLLVPEVLLGWRLLAHRPLGEKWRGLLWIVATFFAAAGASSLPRVGSWPLPTGLGGVLGDALLRPPTWILGHSLHGLTMLIAGLVYAFAAVATTAFAAGLGGRHDNGRREADDKEE
jgi:S-DNA-T family DNA segregation ATPase FtsK/SpoIIIE